jgi:hypothetical protein
MVLFKPQTQAANGFPPPQTHLLFIPRTQAANGFFPPQTHLLFIPQTQANVMFRKCRVGPNHTHIRIHGMNTIFLAGKLPYMRSYTVYIYGSGQPYEYLFLIPVPDCTAVECKFFKQPGPQLRSMNRRHNNTECYAMYYFIIEYVSCNVCLQEIGALSTRHMEEIERLKQDHCVDVGQAQVGCGKGSTPRQMSVLHQR